MVCYRTLEDEQTAIKLKEEIKSIDAQLRKTKKLVSYYYVILRCIQ